MDIKIVFLQGELEEEVYMVQPAKFHCGTNTSAVCHLKKSLNGLKQAPRVWNANITLRLQRMGFASSKSDSSLFFRTRQNGPISILLYVDDLVITGANLGEIRNVKSQLAGPFDMKNLLISTPEGILISQRQYALSMCFKFGMAGCKYISTPLNKNMQLRPDSGQACDAEASSI